MYIEINKNNDGVLYNVIKLKFNGCLLECADLRNYFSDLKKIFRVRKPTFMFLASLNTSSRIINNNEPVRKHLTKTA